METSSCTKFVYSIYVASHWVFFLVSLAAIILIMLKYIVPYTLFIETV